MFGLTYLYTKLRVWRTRKLGQRFLKKALVHRKNPWGWNETIPSRNFVEIGGKNELT
jgi:hypothetical protein